MKLVHTSVMKEEVLQFLAPPAGKSLLIDCTVGEGGHSEAFLQSFPDLRVVGVDADPTILQLARSRLRDFGDRFQGIEGWFDEFFSRYPLNERPDRVLFDLGVSSYHYERSGRGFSFLRDEPLDMRLGKTEGRTAMEIVNTAPLDELSVCFSRFGEERFAKRIARAIVEARVQTPIRTSKELADLIWDAVPAKYRYGRIHPATRCFQALRIVVNTELERLERGLEGAFNLLKVGGRIGVISFHSLEDRIVKHFFRKKGNISMKDTNMPIPKTEHKKIALPVTRKPIRPREEEVQNNPPSRSAKFRVIEKISEEG
ncbi:MAG: 16S rRNA (cytosine(1402)-N(4))-methyltransferase RsmH [Spirochaetes bacterium]|nr:16S rRNA (cytosine(1402)-N(4))-methyltransferase RsmH [Spirochaetota bacterium]